MGNPLPVSLSSECRKASKILNEFVDPVHGLDKVVPLSVLRKARGFAIFSVFRIGMLMSARAGSGIVLAKLEDGQWSAPAAIGLGGLGGGFNAGAELTDFLIILNSTSAVRSFMATGSLQLGGNMSVAAGPFGRTGEVSGSLSSSGGTAAMFSYSKSKGLYGGVSVEGTILVDRSDANSKAYGRSTTSKVILSGNVDVPEFAKPLVSTIERLTQSGGAVGAGLDGDFRNMGIGSHEDVERTSYGPDETDEEALDEYGYPLHSKASRRVKGRRSDSDWDEEPSNSAPPPMKRQWSDADRQAKRENQTRNVGDYVFGRSEARDENDPFADSSATAASSSAKHRFSPSFSRSSSSRNVSAGSVMAGQPTNYADENVSSVSPRAERPKHTRKSSSKGSFSFSALRGKGKTPPPFSDYDPLNPQGSLSKPSAYTNGGDDYAAQQRIQAKKAATKFPTQFANDFRSSSSEDEAAREASNGRYHASPAAAAAPSTSSPSTRRTRQADDTLSNGDYSWDEGEADARSREKYLDEFDRELQSTSPSTSRRRSSTAVPGPSTTPRPFRNSPVSSRPPLSNSSKNSFRPASAASNGGGGSGGRRSTTPTWARKLNFESGGRGSAGARAEEKNDPFFEAYDEARAEGLRRDLVGPAATQRKIKRYDPPPARGPVPLPTPSSNLPDQSAAQGSDQVVAAFDFGGAEPGDLPFRRGDVIDVLRRTGSREDWWHGQCRGRTGDFPANYTEDV